MVKRSYIFSLFLTLAMIICLPAYSAPDLSVGYAAQPVPAAFTGITPDVHPMPAVQPGDPIADTVAMASTGDMSSGGSVKNCVSSGAKQVIAMATCHDLQRKSVTAKVPIRS